MTTAELPRTIRATIHQDALERVPAFFNATIKDILNETLQNARRAGATHVAITSDGESITVADNGRGIENPETILSFGESHWASDAAQREHPAGMGFYALARNPRVTVVSRAVGQEPWQAALEPQHFNGHEAAAVTKPDPDEMPEHGTAVTFVHQGDPTYAVNEAGKFYPIPVSHNGKPVNREDFLERMSYIETWKGVRIGVRRTSFSPDNHRRLNFHGIVLTKVNLPMAKTLDHHWSVRLDVLDADGLELTLPARRELVETPFTQELRNACARAIYNAIRLDPEGIDVPYTLQQEARAAGVEIPSAKPRLRHWQARQADHHAGGWAAGMSAETTETGPDTLVMQYSLEPCDQQALERAARQNGLLPRIMRANAELEGYTWYDSLTRIVRVKFTARYGDTVEDLNTRRGSELPALEDLRPDAITMFLETRDENGRFQTISLPADAVFELDEEDYPGEAAPLVAKDSGIGVEELADFIMRSWFSPNEDSESDSYETQKQYAAQSCHETAVGILSTGDEALVRLLAEAAEKHLNYRLPQDSAAVITLKRGTAPQVEIRHGG